MLRIRIPQLLKPLVAALTVAFAAQIAIALADPQFEQLVNQLAPVFGVAIAITLIGGLRYIPWIFAGALVPSVFVYDELLEILSVPLATVLCAILSYRLTQWLDIRHDMERIRDTLSLLIVAGIIATALSAAIESALLCGGNPTWGWGEFPAIFMTHWLAASVGSIISLPFILVWAQPKAVDLTTRQMGEVLIWIVTLIGFGVVTFQNWAPTDTLLYPMELAIFPIMAWGAIRLGLRGASAGVLVLALVAAWQLLPVLGSEVRISQSPANVWVFVGIVSITSVCLASVMNELRKREAQVADNESRLRAFTDGLPDIGFVLSSEGVICDIFSANHRIEANHRIVNSEVLRGKPLSHLFDDRTTRRFGKTIQTALESGKVETCEYELESVDVGKHFFEARVSRMVERTGESDRVVWVAYDISERKKSEAAIKQRDGILQASARANNTLLTTSNFGEAIETAIADIGRALGAERVHVFEILDRSLETLFSFNCSVEWSKNSHVPTLLKQHQPIEGPFEEYFPGWYEQMHTDGAIALTAQPQLDRDAVSVLRHLDCQAILAIPMWIRGKLNGFLSIEYCTKPHTWNQSEINAVRVLASSISGLILIEENQRALKIARDRASAASVAKGEFLSVMSHEIRTPMNAILGYADLLSQTDLSELQSEQTSIIRRSGKALLALINNILDYSKIEANVLELESEQFDLEQLVCEALEGVLYQAKDKGLEVDFKIDSAVGEFYIGDPHRLKQILINLANNAVKFTNQGSVQIHVQLSDCTHKGSYDRLRFKVIDTGCGIEPNALQKIFEPFLQEDSSTTRRYGGTGLGLAISQRLVERMDGSLRAESTLGKGSTFLFEIELQRPEQAKATRNLFSNSQSQTGLVSPDFAKRHPLTILLCEDDDDNRWMINELLQQMGYQPQLATDATEASQQLFKHRFDVILLDVRLPEQSGIELTKAIRSGDLHPRLTQQYIIAVTAFAMQEDREDCLAAGMNDYLRKPIEIEELKNALIEAHNQKDEA